MNTFHRKKVGNAETTKMDHLRMYIFLRENWGAALECVVFSEKSGKCRVLFQNVHYSYQELVEDLRGTCEGPEPGEERKVLIELR